jgi:hypothetical protein
MNKPSLSSMLHIALEGLLVSSQHALRFSVLHVSHMKW